MNAVLLGWRQQRPAREQRREANERVAGADHSRGKYAQRGESLAHETHNVYASPRDRQREPTP